ncbi:uncharacterized protein si:dkey-103g5.4, partial [Heptranchias perlo]|uniref:uncharacterized protein si:dkey-103g5.4 n=1 Tax=Heptranchias perlo TaxID=212740 RepID=UPI003559BC39
MNELQKQLENMNSKKRLNQEEREMAFRKKIKELEAEIEKEQKVDEEIVMQKQLKKERRQNLQMMEEKVKLQDQLERGELTHILKEKLTKEHSERQRLLEDTLQQEITQVKKDQEVKREKKRADDRRRITGKLAAEEQEEEARHSQQVQQILNEATRAFEQIASFVALKIPLLQPRPSQPLEEDWANLLAQSPLFKLLKEINEHLKANPEAEELSSTKDHQQGTSQTEAKYQETHRPFIDIMDAQWTCEGKLVPLTLEKISVTELVIYRFGIFIVQLVKRSINAPEINILLASSLPTNNYTRNAFRNSFFYQHSQKKLFIRRQRLASVGDFSLFLVHCLAHLTADELTDDSNPLFLKLFHQAMKALFNDMFFTRLRSPPALHTLETRASTWDNLFR